jgi:hypothetical protein
MPKDKPIPESDPRRRPFAESGNPAYGAANSPAEEAQVTGPNNRSDSLYDDPNLHETSQGEWFDEGRVDPNGGPEPSGAFNSGNAYDYAAPNRNPNGRWGSGTSGNPAGRPPGSRNKTTLMMQELLEGEGGSLVRKAMEMALGGSTHAMRLCLERLMPPQRERLIDLPLPDVKTVQDSSTALSKILSAVGEGRITPGEGETLARILEAQKRVIEVEDLERRIADLEKGPEEDE